MTDSTPAVSELSMQVSDLLDRIDRDGDEYNATTTIRMHLADLARQLADARRDADALRSHIADVYAKVPFLPITAETCDAATDALHEFCLILGVHNIEPADAAMSGGTGE